MISTAQIPAFNVSFAGIYGHATNQDGDQVDFKLEDDKAKMVIEDRTDDVVVKEMYIDIAKANKELEKLEPNAMHYTNYTNVIINKIDGNSELTVRSKHQVSQNTSVCLMKDNAKLKIESAEVNIKKLAGKNTTVILEDNFSSIKVDKESTFNVVSSTINSGPKGDQPVKVTGQNLYISG